MSAAKELIFEEEARAKLQAGIQKLAEASAVTLGPKGRYVGLEKSWGPPQVTSDGQTIVSQLDLPDPYEDMGAKIGREAAAKVKEIAGDGTTTTILLLRALVDGGIKNIAAGASPIGLKRGMEKGLTAILEALKKQATPVKSSLDRQAIATISASGDTAIGKRIADAIDRVGEKGAVTIEEGKTLETELEVVEGMRFDRGYLSAHFINDPETLSVVLERPAILIADQKIASIQEILPLLQEISLSGRPLLIIAEDVEGSCLATLVINKLRGSLNVCAVRAPAFGDRRSEILADIATLVAGKCFSEKVGDKLTEAAGPLLGSCDRVIVTKDTTTIVGGAGTAKQIATRVAQIDHEIGVATGDYEKKQLEERKARLQGGVAVIRVGGATEPEMKETKQRMEDSLRATRAAMEEGIVTGGGVALLKAAAAVKALSLEGDEAVGAKLVAAACQAPVRQLAANSGLDGSVILGEMAKLGGEAGLNVEAGVVEDLQEAQVVDAAKVPVAALTHAVSSAGILLLSEVLISDAPEE
ncbi:MAG: chaperonin GroEL [Parachlamydiales bacterium]